MKQLFTAVLLLSAMWAQNNGLVVTKYSDGGLKVEGNYANGVRNGAWAEYWQEVWWYDYGEDGDDILDGGDGKDRLYGGNGSDIFIGRSGDGSSGFTGANIIYDFEDGVDKIRLEGDLSFSNVSIAQGTQGSFSVGGQTFYYDYRSHTLVSANNEYLFTIIDTNHSTISSADFIY